MRLDKCRIVLKNKQTNKQTKNSCTFLVVFPPTCFGVSLSLSSLSLIFIFSYKTRRFLFFFIFFIVYYLCKTRCLLNASSKSATPVKFLVLRMVRVAVGGQKRRLLSRTVHKLFFPFSPALQYVWPGRLNVEVCWQKHPALTFMCTAGFCCCKTHLHKEPRMWRRQNIRPNIFAAFFFFLLLFL